MAQVFNILDRRKPGPLHIAEADDFVLEDSGATISAQAIVENPHITPYCFDPGRGRVLLVETPAVVDLAGAAFLYDAQHRHALRVHAIELDVLNAIADRLPDPEQLLLIHSTGRCGSTLLVNAFRELDHVAVCSEPDVFTQLALAGRPQAPAIRTALVRALRSYIRLLCRSRLPLHVIKLRSMVIEHAELLAEAMPRARQVFMYRDARDVARSTARVLGLSMDDWRTDAAGLRGWTRLAPMLARYHAQPDQVGADHLLACLWAGGVLRYLETCTSATWIGALRYEDLMREPQATFAALFATCGLSTVDAARASAALQHDSQAGTALARERLQIPDPLSARHLYAIAARLRELRADLAPDMILPRTIVPRAHAGAPTVDAANMPP